MGRGSGVPMETDSVSGRTLTSERPATAIREARGMPFDGCGSAEEAGPSERQLSGLHKGRRCVSASGVLPCGPRTGFNLSGRGGVCRTLGISCETRLNDAKPDWQVSSKVIWFRQLHALVRRLVLPATGRAPWSTCCGPPKRGTSDTTSPLDSRSSLRVDTR
jgi:hypothetical protein